MNFYRKFSGFITAIILSSLLLSTSFTCVSAENTTAESIGTVYTFGDDSLPHTKIEPQIINGTITLVLPSVASPDKVTLFCDEDVIIKGNKANKLISGKTTVDLTSLCSDGDYSVKVASSMQEDSEYKLKILFSENISTMYIASESPEKKGRLWVEDSKTKSNKAKGSMILQKSNSDIIYNGKLSQIKGRGNTTWGFEKKPYQIKLETTTDLLQTGNKNNASKTWVLLANYLDSTLLRNSLALSLGKSLGMDCNIETNYIDLYYDGEYRGNYLLSEKVEVGNGRVDVTDLDKANEKANPNVVMENLPVSTAVTKNGATYTYCEGLKSPDDITGGYLIEMDYEVRAVEEVCYFYTKRKQHVVVKSPEFATKEEMDYIATLYQEYEDAVYNNGINPTTKKSYSDYVDKKSVASYYLVNEFSKSRDCFKSSAYLHKDAGNNKMYMGPLWDYDMSFGTGGDDYTVMDSPHGTIVSESEFNLALMSIEDFYSTVSELYISDFYPAIEKALSDIPSDSVYSIANMHDKISASTMCNAFMWHPEKDMNNEVQNLIDFIVARKELIKELCEAFPSFSSLTEDDFLDVLPSQWYYNDITTASKYGLLNGARKNIFLPNENVTRAQAVQALFNTSGITEVNYLNSFSDVRRDKWYTNAVEWAVQNGICPTASKSFYPNNEITREEFVTFLYHHQKSPKADASALDSYTDAEEISEVSKDAVIWATANNILTGDDNKIYPKKNMTRAEFAAMLVRYYEKFLK